MEHIMDIRKVSGTGGDHPVDLQSQGSQQGDNGDDGNDALDDMQNPAENYVRTVIPAGGFFDIGLDFWVIGLGGMAHGQFLLFRLDDLFYNDFLKKGRVSGQFCKLWAEICAF
jgi:hypothetical protein